MNNPHTLAVETDTRLAEVFAYIARIEQRRDFAVDQLHRAAKHTRPNGPRGAWGETLQKAIETVEAGPEHTYGRNDLITYRECIEALTDLNAERLDLQDVWFDNGMWSRFFLVTNTNGHIHRDMNCSTCFNTTQYAWLPGLSGLSEAEAVEDQGGILCSVCFPSAPVEWTNGTSKVDQAAKAQRAAEKAARDAKKAEKALVPTDVKHGLQISYVSLNYRTQERRIVTRDIVTIAQAKTYITDCAAYGTAPEAERSPQNLAFVLTAYAERIGSTPEAEWDAAQKRAAKRR